jgi:hypothetical protein
MEVCCQSFSYQGGLLSELQLSGRFVVRASVIREVCCQSFSYQGGLLSELQLSGRFVVRASVIREVWDLIKWLNTATFFRACPKPGPGFPMSYVMVYFMFSELR